MGDDYDNLRHCKHVRHHPLRRAMTRTPLDIYREYRIYRGLQDHQLRVAAVGKYIDDRSHTRVDTRLIILAGLFHDMGNIIKARLHQPSPLIEPEGLEHWQQVKKEFHEKYGDNEHDATREICRDIGLPEEVVQLIDDMGFSKMERTLESGSPDLKVVEYADMRVAPYGVLSLDERQREARERYADRDSATHKHAFGDVERYEYLLGKTHELETNLMVSADFQPEEITDASVVHIIEELKGFPVS